MKHFILGLALALGLVLMAPAAPVAADSDSADGGGSWWSWFFGGRWGRGGRTGGNATVPELDPNVAGSAVVLLLGGVAYIASRRRDDD